MRQNHLQHQEDSLSTEVADTLTCPQLLTDPEAVETSLPQEQSESMEVLGVALSQESQRFQRGVARGMVGLSAFGALLIAGKFVFGEEGWNALLPADAIIPSMLCSLLILSLFLVTSAHKPRRRRRILTARVAEQYDVRSIGPLIDALHLEDGKAREIAITALTDLLPRLKVSDTALLNEAQRAKLCHLLSVPVENMLHKDVRALFRPADNRAIAFRVAILQAFAQVGNSKALPIVKQLATREPRTDGERRIHEAAEVCLPTLQLRVEQAQSSQTLLRASHSSDMAPDTLLRAASGSQKITPDELLRASERT